MAKKKGVGGAKSVPMGGCGPLPKKPGLGMGQ